MNINTSINTSATNYLNYNLENLFVSMFKSQLKGLTIHNNAFSYKAKPLAFSFSESFMSIHLHVYTGAMRIIKEKLPPLSSCVPSCVIS